ncbi:MAG TPA: class I SAM-dependent methyltransferase family protein [Acidimicrobiales bacterium]|nr:class I SAM-dependent methyltransferase family protein [Acidimicrobiales bacterium]
MGDREAERAAARDWVGWHRSYDDPNTGLSWRLGVVRSWIQRSVDGSPPGPVRVISMCAGQGRDLIGALAGHHRRGDVAARLVELDPRNAEVARHLASEAGLAGVEVVIDDAGNTSAYEGAVPADLILVCGVFGNIGDEDIETTVAALPGLAAPGATVIWTRHTRHPDLTGQIRAWFAQAGFDELAFEKRPKGPQSLATDPLAGAQSVGANRLSGSTKPFRPGRTLFRFVGYDKLQDSAAAPRTP